MSSSAIPDHHHLLPKDYTEQDTAPVGTGPFLFVSRTAQESVVLERFDDYWGEKPDLTKVTYKIIENADSILLSLQSGAVDVFAHLTTNQIELSLATASMWRKAP